MTPERDRLVAMLASARRSIVPPPTLRESLLPLPCLIWQGSQFPSGYGQRRLPKAEGGKGVTVHIWAWTVTHGKPPEGLVLDHQCHNLDLACPGGNTCPHRPCFAPDHLRLATRMENTAAGRTSVALGMERDACARGHRWTPETLRWRPPTRSGGRRRRCLICHRDDEARRRREGQLTGKAM